MKTTSTSFISNINVRYGFIAAMLYVIFFAIMKVTGLAYHTELRYMNYVIYFFAGYYALKTAANERGNKFTYLQGFGIAFVVGAVSFLLFALFVFIYSFFDTFFTDTIFKEYPTAISMGKYAPPFLVASEGIGFSAIFSLCLMQFFRIYTGRKRKVAISEGKTDIVSEVNS